MEFVIYFSGVLLMIIIIGIANSYIKDEGLRIPIFFCLGSFGTFILLFFLCIIELVLVMFKKIPDSIYYLTFFKKKKDNSNMF